MTAVQEIDRFVQGLGRRHRIQVLRRVLIEWGAGLAVLVVLVFLLFPPLLGLIVVAAVLDLVLIAAWVLWRRQFRVRDVDRRLELKDRLTTWQGLRRRQEPATPMAAWLTDDLAGRIEAIPEPRRRAAVACKLGLLRYFVPVLILLTTIVLLLVLLAFIPPFGGASGGAGGGGAGDTASGGGGDPGGSSGSGESDPQTGEQEQAPPTDDPMEAPPPPAAPTPPLGGPPPPPEGANPLPELEVRDEFAVPHFVGEGETRRQLARQASVADDRPTAVPPAGSAGSAGQPPVTQEMDFEQAEERALQSRHVPDEERAFLRRYFRILRERSR